MRNNQTSKKKFVNAEKWGKDIVIACWKFSIDIWKCRNDTEHGNEQTTAEKNAIKKKKLIEKIQWLKTKNTELDQLYTKSDEKDLMKLPIDNLLMMEINLTKNKVGPPIGGQGKSLPLDYKK
jgi:hypothetical protein